MAALVIAVVLSAVALIGLFFITPLFAKWVSLWRPDWLNQQGLKAKLAHFLVDFNRSLQAVRRSNKASLVLAISVLIRVLKYSGFYLLFYAVASESFPELANLPIQHVVSALIGGEIGASLPIPAFMSFGVYEAGSSLVFQLLGVADQAAAFVTMLCVHIWSCLLYTSPSPRDLSTSRMPSSA